MSLKSRGAWHSQICKMQSFLGNTCINFLKTDGFQFILSIVFQSKLFFNYWLQNHFCQFLIGALVLFLSLSRDVNKHRNLPVPVVGIHTAGTCAGIINLFAEHSMPSAEHRTGNADQNSKQINKRSETITIIES